MNSIEKKRNELTNQIWIISIGEKKLPIKQKQKSEHFHHSYKILFSSIKRMNEINDDIMMVYH